MCDRALLAISSAKDTDKKISYYNDSLRGNILFTQQLNEEAVDAMRNGQIQIYLQPQVEVMAL